MLEGTRLHAETERKLRAWYLRHVAAAHPSVVDPETAGAALELLTAGMPAEHRVALAETFLAAVSNECRRAELPPPEWVAALAA